LGPYAAESTACTMLEHHGLPQRTFTHTPSATAITTPASASHPIHPRIHMCAPTPRVCAHSFGHVHSINILFLSLQQIHVALAFTSFCPKFSPAASPRIVDFKCFGTSYQTHQCHIIIIQLNGTKSTNQTHDQATYNGEKRTYCIRMCKQSCHYNVLTFSIISGGEAIS
jgi:hypothetical protein